MSGTYTTTMIADGKTHVFSGLLGKEVSRLLHHFDVSALSKVLDMIPEADDLTGDGPNDVKFTCRTVRDSTNKDVGGQSNDWLGVSDAVAGALNGAFDAALATLDKHLASKKR
jgi:hypothetical protein